MSERTLESQQGRKRVLQLQRGVIDLDTGEFPLILASNGEASDGHIIDVGGMEVGERIPMFANHNADPLQRMGGLIRPSIAGNVKKLGRAFLKMVGVIDMTGDSALAEIRRDVAQGISLGDLTQMSLRWDDLEAPIARAALDKKHFAYSEAGADSWNTPMFFARTEAREGSIVGLAADQAALIGRSRDLTKPSHVREFYEILARGGDPEQMVDDLCGACAARDLDTQIREDVESLSTQPEELAQQAPEPEPEQEEAAPQERTQERPAPVPDSVELLDLLRGTESRRTDPDALSGFLDDHRLPETTRVWITGIEDDEEGFTVDRIAQRLRQVHFEKLGKI